MRPRSDQRTWIDTGRINTGPIDTGPIDTGPIDTDRIDTDRINTGLNRAWSTARIRKSARAPSETGRRQKQGTVASPPEALGSRREPSETGGRQGAGVAAAS
ncbi:hypothetical protein Psi02_22360 [Planotetraspora silvatica]|uniref:Uncharacterized protein n=1 Tax=Planotetraspora silvatica TaxID=234614 RepID=A0A8J3UIY4_9ACTN|nr:hypothetical protein Psi02_22360 [Planotetraspora silvatica]